MSKTHQTIDLENTTKVLSKNKILKLKNNVFIKLKEFLT